MSPTRTGKSESVVFRWNPCKRAHSFQGASHIKSQLIPLLPRRQIWVAPHKQKPVRNCLLFAKITCHRRLLVVTFHPRPGATLIRAPNRPLHRLLQTTRVTPAWAGRACGTAPFTTKLALPGQVSISTTSPPSVGRGGSLFLLPAQQQLCRHQNILCCRVSQQDIINPSILHPRSFFRPRAVAPLPLSCISSAATRKCLMVHTRPSRPTCPRFSPRRLLKRKLRLRPISQSPLKSPLSLPPRAITNVINHSS
jgi:hypothetical protein